jgi:hypothetical protein
MSFNLAGRGLPSVRETRGEGSKNWTTRDLRATIWSREGRASEPFARRVGA